MIMNNTYVAIMAGGIGSRFWPASRINRPKQFLDILGTGQSLIQLTYERFLNICPKENIFVVTNGLYKDLVLEQLPDLTDNQVLCEPSRNNTGPCVAYTAFKLHDLDPDANFIVAPSDHLVVKESAFVSALQTALAFTAANDALCTLGIQPTRPDTGYGYIQYAAEPSAPAPDHDDVGGVHPVVEFKEKPDADTARSYLDAGNYLWNAGIFIWRARAVLDAFEQNAHEIYEILKTGRGKYNTAEEQTFIDATYPTTPSISVDYAIMERATNIYTIPADIGWSDLGTWASLHEEMPGDERHNTTQGGNILTLDADNCLIRAPKGKLVIVKDLDNFIIVDEEDVLLIYPKNKEQEIKAVTRQVSAIAADKL